MRTCFQARGARGCWGGPATLLIAAYLALAACERASLRESGAVRASDGYVLYSPLLSTTTYLVDRSGQVVHTWESELGPGASVYLLGDGRLLRPARHPDVPVFHDGGMGGRIQRFDWNGCCEWDWTFASAERVQHHDVEPLPNGNVLLLAWEAKSRDEAIRAGRDPRRVGAGGLWSESVFEVRPQPPHGGTIVWEWHAWDHLIQQRDLQRDNFGRVADHPERIDLNGDRGLERWTDAFVARLRALGYVAGAAPLDVDADFLHANSVAYEPRLDQIVISVFGFDEIWVVDHSTTPLEAAGSFGGRAGRGGDLLYRWGNPRAYGRGRGGDRHLFGQHDARWIPAGHPGVGHLLVFNNGLGRLGGRWSSVLELETPLGVDGTYAISERGAYGPEAPVWEYVASPRESFYADFISGAQRLSDGNTFVTDGPRGRFFEVTPRGEIVWEYSNPYSGNAANPAGDPPYSLFRATFVPADHPALRGRELRPLVPQPRRGRD